MNHPFANQNRRLGSMGVPRPSQQPMVIEAEVVQESAPAGHAEVAPAGQTGTGAESAGLAPSGITQADWNRLSPEQRLAYRNASAADQRRIIDAIAAGASTLITQIFDQVNRDRQSQLDREMQASRERIARLQLEGQLEQARIENARLASLQTERNNVVTSGSSAPSFFSSIPTWAWVLGGVGVAFVGYKYMQGQKKSGRKKK